MIQPCKPATAEGQYRRTARTAGVVGGGFTIVELLIAVVVVALLAAVVTVAYNGANRRAEESKLASDARNAAQYLEMHRADSDRYPASDDSIPRSEGTSLQYTASSDGSSYCLTVSSGSVAFRQLSGGGPEPGVCDDHRAPGEPVPVIANSCPSGFIPVPGSPKFSTDDFCVMKYEAKDVGGIAVSQPEGEPWQATKSDALQAAQGACGGCRLMSVSEWLTIGHNALGVASNWSGGSVGSGAVYTGRTYNEVGSADLMAASHNDADGYFGASTGAPLLTRRTLTLSNGEVIWDMAGNALEIVSEDVTQELVDAVESGAPADATEIFKEWNALELPAQFSSLQPAFGTPAAAQWSSAQGLGTIGADMSNDENELDVAGLLVGGGVNITGSVGLLALYIHRNEESEAGAGFRATV